MINIWKVNVTGDITFNIEPAWIDVTFASQKVLVGFAYRRTSDGEFNDRLQ